MNGSFAGKEEFFFCIPETRLDSMWFGETSMSSSEDIKKNILTEKKTKRMRRKIKMEGKIFLRVCLMGVSTASERGSRTETSSIRVFL